MAKGMMATQLFSDFPICLHNTGAIIPNKHLFRLFLIISPSLIGRFGSLKGLIFGYIRIYLPVFCLNW